MLKLMLFAVVGLIVSTIFAGIALWAPGLIDTDGNPQRPLYALTMVLVCNAISIALIALTMAGTTFRVARSGADTTMYF